MYKERKKKPKKQFGNFPFISVIFSVSLSLLLLGIFSFFLLSSLQIKTLIEENTEINIYLNKNLSINKIDQIKRTLYSKDYVLINDESTLEYISSDDAAIEFSEELGEDFTKFLGNNPLRDLIILKINPKYFDSSQLIIVEEDITKISGVYEVDYSKDLISNINKNIKSISLVFIGIFLILFLISIVLINNTLRIALFSQRFLIRSMQLVGATSNYILKPFLIRGMFYGIVSGIIASILLLIIITFSNDKLNGLNFIASSEKLSIIFISIILTGIIMVVISTYTSVNKYLNSSLDELYN
jgi:cell division transport system permease protein|tara:strand:- start:11719 stop:12615 length:897 start_codon:yes stop_codon:yes gene_type:complete